jgi:hypothetical protein
MYMPPSYPKASWEESGRMKEGRGQRGADAGFLPGPSSWQKYRQALSHWEEVAGLTYSPFPLRENQAQRVPWSVRVLPVTRASHPLAP